MKRQNAFSPNSRRINVSQLNFNIPVNKQSTVRQELFFNSDKEFSKFMDEFNATDNIIKKHKLLRQKSAFEDMYFKPAF